MMNWRKRLGKLGKFFLLTTVVIYASSISVAANADVVIKGSTTVLPITQSAAEKFMNENPEVDISVQGGGSGVGIAALIEGTCDIADASRPMKDKELNKAISRGIDPKAHVIAMDGIALIVHRSNRINALTKEEIREIYTGKISNWAQVGGDSQKIVVVSRDSASGTFETFNKLALDKARVRPDALLQASNRAVLSTVARTPGGIGYIGLGYVTSSVKVLTIDGIVPSKETVLSAEYKFSRPLFMYTNGKPTGATKKFIDYILSAEGQKLVEKVGYIGLK